MKKIIIMDTETSDIKDAKIGQLSYILFDNIIKPFNAWFALDYVSPDASKVNGLTVEKLATLSKGQVFQDVAERVYEDLKDALIICHNVGFDYPLVADELRVATGKGLFNSTKRFCTMQYYTPIIQLDGPYGYKWPKLIETVDYLGIDVKQIELAAIKIFKESGIGFHDARFDVAATYLICRKLVEDRVGTKNYDYNTLRNTLYEIQKEYEES